MIHFPHSTFTWKNNHWKPDPYYRYAGGFVGKPGQVYQVRFNIEACCRVRPDRLTTDNRETELFLSAPCRTEYTIAARNLFQVPSGEFRYAFSRNCRLSVARKPSTEKEDADIERLDALFQHFKIDIQTFSDVRQLTNARQIAEATLNGDLMNAASTYRDDEKGITVTVEYPVNLININEDDEEFQVCTGPVLLPDLNTWDGNEVHRVFVAHAAITSFDYVEFILRREVEPSEEEKAWLDEPRGRDRNELRDPKRKPAGYPPRRPRPTVYNEVWGLDAVNTMTATKND